LPDRQLQDQALRALRYELDLPADMRRREVLKRLRAWLLLDPSEASRLARAFDDAGSRLDDAERELVRETEEDAVMDGLSFREFERLAGFMPSLAKWRTASLRAGLPRSGIPASLAAALALAGSSLEV